MVETVSPFRPAKDGIGVAVRLNPRAARNRVAGVVADEKGEGALRVTVTAAPADGRANAALVKLLAKEWGMAKTALRLTRGAKDRNKFLVVDGPPEATLKKLEAWADKLGR